MLAVSLLPHHAIQFLHTASRSCRFPSDAVGRSACGLKPQTHRLRCTTELLRRAQSASSHGADNVESWKAKDLRAFLDARQVSHTDCFEKKELVERVKACWNQTPTSSTAPEASPKTYPGFGELVIIDPTGSPVSGKAASLLFLHGFGDTARGWASKLPDLLKMPEVRYVLPTASRSGGMSSWFDISRMMAGPDLSQVDNAVMRESIDYCHHLIQAELDRGVDPSRVFIGGFSQGGCLAVRAALEFDKASLGGCIAISTFVGSSERLPISGVNARLPVLCCHGDNDRMVPTSEGRRLADVLKSRNLAIDFRTYPGLDHAYCEQEVLDVTQFLRRRLAVSIGDDGLRRMSARELKAMLRNIGADTSACFDKEDLLERARSTLLVN